MGKQIKVKPQEIDQHVSEMSDSISALKEVEFDDCDMDNTNLKSVDKLLEIIAEFEEAMELYTTLADNDVEKVGFVKEEMVKEDSRLASFCVLND